MADYKGIGDELAIKAIPGELLDEFATRAVKECREYGGAASVTFNGSTIHIGTGWEAPTVARTLERELLEQRTTRTVPNVTIGPLDDPLKGFRPVGWWHPDHGAQEFTGSDKDPEPRLNVLAEAARVVSGDRQKAYGHPLDNHSATAEFWTTWLRRRYGADMPTLDYRDVCQMMIFQKGSRHANNPKRDNLVDQAGYAHNEDQADIEKAAREAHE